MTLRHPHPETLTAVTDRRRAVQAAQEYKDSRVDALMDACVTAFREGHTFDAVRWESGLTQDNLLHLVEIARNEARR